MMDIILGVWFFYSSRGGRFDSQWLCCLLSGFPFNLSSSISRSVVQSADSMPTSSSSTQVLLVQQLVDKPDLFSCWPVAGRLFWIPSSTTYNNKKKNAQKNNVKFSSRAAALGSTRVYRFHGGIGESRVYLCYFPPTGARFCAPVEAGLQRTRSYFSDRSTFFHIWCLQNQIFWYRSLDFDSHPPSHIPQSN